MSARATKGTRVRTRKSRRGAPGDGPRAVEYGALVLAVAVVATLVVVALGHYVLAALQLR